MKPESEPTSAARDSYENQIASLADRWRRLAVRHSGMRPDEVARAAIDAACFTLRNRCHDLTVPIVLEATSRHQEELVRLCNKSLEFGTRLKTGSEGMQIEVSHRDDVLGLIPTKHVAWIRPLLPLGADVRLARLTGYDSDSDPLSATVMVTRVGRALAKLEIATGSRSAGVVAEPRTIYLWRDAEGTPHTSLTSRHSDPIAPHDWGYGGSGPAQLALTILEHFLSEEEAWALHGAFKDQVLDPMPWEGGELSADRVKRWIKQEQESRVCC